MSTEALIALNPGLVCTNLQIGQVICRAASTVTITVANPKSSSIATTSSSFSSSAAVSSSRSSSFSSSSSAPQSTRSSVTPSTAPRSSYKSSSAAPVSTSTPTTCSKRYAIKSGDLCWIIAPIYNLSVDSLVALNPGLVCTNLQIGQSICVKA
jgi:LysM repeat protein